MESLFVRPEPLESGSISAPGPGLQAADRRATDVRGAVARPSHGPCRVPHSLEIGPLDLQHGLRGAAIERRATCLAPGVVAHESAPTGARAVSGHAPSSEQPQKPGEQPQAPKPEVSKMSQQQLEKAAQDIHDAAYHRNLGGYGWNSPQADPVKTVLGTMNQADREALKNVYENKFHTKLQDDINTKFGGDGVAKSEINALMMRQDGKSDEAGTIHTALAKLADNGAAGSYDSGSDSARAEGQIRNALASMTAKQIAELRETYQKNYSTSLDAALSADPNLSDDSKHAIGIYLKGIDNRTSQDTSDLAQTGLAAHRLDMFQEAMQYASPADRQAFMANGGQDKINQAFDGGDAKVATDYATKGYVGLNTIVDGDTHWYHTNKDDIGRAVDNAQPDEKVRFQLGKKLADSGQAPQTNAEKQAVNFYQQTEKAFHAAGNERQAQIWTAKLNGSESVVNNILQTQHDGFLGIGKGHDKNALYGAIENLSPQDWQSLKQNPDHLKDVDKALQAISDDGERGRLMQMLKDKLALNSYADSQNVGRRPVTEALQDAGTDTNLQANALLHMTPAERDAYRNNAQGFADSLNGAVKQNMKSDGASLVAQDLLGQIKAGQEPKLTALDKVAIASDKTDNALGTATDIEAAFKADPSLLARIKNPQNAQDQQLQRVFQGALNNAVDKAGLGAQCVGEGGDIPSQYPDFAKTLLETGHLPIEQKMQLVGDNKMQQLGVLQLATPEEKAALLNANPDAKTKALQDAVLGDEPQRSLFRNVLQQGQMTDADQFRAYALGYGGDSSALLQRLDQMTPQAKQDLASDYFAKYGSLIGEDVVAKAQPSERFRFVEELQPADQNVRQVALDARAENDRHTSAFDDVMRDCWDYSGVAAKDSAQQLNTFVAQHAAEIDNLPPEQRKQFTDAVNAYMTAQQSYIDSKGAAAEAVVDTAITVAAIGGAVFTGGTSLALLGCIGAGGAIFRVGAMRAMEGSDFDSSVKGVAEQAFKGGTAAMMGFVGPEMFGVKGVLVADQRQALEQALEEAIAKGVKQQVTASIREKLINESASALMSVATGSGANVATEIASTAVGLSDPKTLLERVEGAAVAGAAGASVFHFAFRAASFGYHGLTAAIGRDANSPHLLSAGFTDAEGRNWQRSRTGDMTWRADDGSTYTDAEGKEEWVYSDGRQRVKYSENEDYSYDPTRGWKDRDGNEIWPLSNGLAVNRPDGSSIQKLNDGTTVSHSADQSHVEIKNGKHTTEIKYSRNPRQIAEVKLANGRTLERISDSSFRDTCSGRIVDAQIKIDSDGNVCVDDGLTETKYTPDNRVERHNSPAIFLIEGNLRPSKKFIETVDRTFLDLPPEVRQLLKKHGIRVVIGDSIPDVNPSLEGVQPRAHGKSAKWDYVEGYYDPVNKIAVTTEHYRARNGDFLETKRADGVMRHEVGHAVDFALGRFSRDKKFMNAYDQDKAWIESNLSAADKKRLRYFLHAGVGRLEVFAEVFGILQGGGCAKTNEALVRRAFLQTVRIIEERLEDLKATGI